MWYLCVTFTQPRVYLLETKGYVTNVLKKEKICVSLLLQRLVCKTQYTKAFFREEKSFPAQKSNSSAPHEWDWADCPIAAQTLHGGGGGLPEWDNESFCPLGEAPRSLESRPAAFLLGSVSFASADDLAEQTHHLAFSCCVSTCRQMTVKHTTRCNLIWSFQTHKTAARCER